MAVLTQKRVLHVRFGGRSFDVPFAGLDLSEIDSERAIKHRLAAYLEVNVHQLADHVLDRHPNGNLTLRPEAVFG